MNRLSLFFLCTLSVAALSVNGQDKYERESRLKEEMVPEKAISFVKALSLERKIKWYREEAINRITIEAKSKFKAQNISIEFDTLGNVEDIEIETPWKEIPSIVSKKIIEHLESNFTKHHIRKVQIQYLGNRQELLDFFQNNLNSKDIDRNYEIVLKGVTEDSIELYEFLFTDQGKLLRKSKIIFRNTDNLQF